MPVIITGIHFCEPTTFSTLICSVAHLRWNEIPEMYVSTHRH